MAALDRAGAALQVLSRRVAEAHDLSSTQLRVLSWLHVGPPPEARSTALARELNVADPTVSDAIGALIRKGLVERRRDPSDGRSHQLVLTAAGRALAPNIYRWSARAEIAVSKLERAEGERVLDSLLQILASLHQAELLPVARACTTCVLLEVVGQEPRAYRCSYYGIAMQTSDLRVDCADHLAART